MGNIEAVGYLSNTIPENTGDIHKLEKLPHISHTVPAQKKLSKQLFSGNEVSSLPS